MASMRKFVLPALTIVVLLSACASNKKRKCNTCPKWEDRIEWTTQRAAHEEQYQPGSRP
jgi:outer membrane biogenesis lipoprotein LolB